MRNREDAESALAPRDLALKTRGCRHRISILEQRSLHSQLLPNDHSATESGNADIGGPLRQPLRLLDPVSPHERGTEDQGVATKDQPAGGCQTLVRQQVEAQR